ncbi:hypothetical protein GCM10027321_15770 [Massilia terrae]|uniref:Class I lanthipeptide n=1 Tax=Massilia terrae TaxID=1811224 RepID=A0ABT2D132_9BURK|nr:class I lanthipeptide [Massilia terrae]MCS0659958.1 class I lanthipeptide [Massilia terrae]
MAKKIQLHKQTLRVLSADEMEAVSGGALPATQGCLSVNCITDDPSSTTTTSTTATALPATQGCLSVNC